MPTPDEPTVCHLRPFTAGDHNMLADAQMWLSDAEEIAESLTGYGAETLMYLLGDARSALTHMQTMHADDPNIPNSDALHEADDAEAARETAAWLSEQPDEDDPWTTREAGARLDIAFEQIVDGLW